MSYDVGDLVRVSAVFTDSTGANVDPATVKVTYETPAGVSTTLTYLVDVALVRDSAGHYHADIDANAAGTWRYRWFSTGAGQAAGETAFHVRASEI